VSRWQPPGRPAVVAGAGALAAGALAAGAGMLAAGGLAERLRGLGRRPDQQDAQALGGLRGEPVTVLAEDGVPLHVEVDDATREGQGSDLTVIFCHGYVLTADSWHFQRRDLRGLGRLVFWDQRSHGRSGRASAESANVDQLGRDLALVIAATAPSGPVVLVGHSMGGMTIMALADQAPELFGERVIGVALISTSPGALAEVTLGIPARTARLARRLTPGVLAVAGRQAPLVELGRRASGELEAALTKHYAFASAVPRSVSRFAAELIAGTPVDVIAEFWPAFDAHDKQAALPVFQRVETLILVGEDDLVTPADHSREMVDAVPGAELVVVPRAGHLVFLEHPDVVNHCLRDLVTRARRGAEA